MNDYPEAKQWWFPNKKDSLIPTKYDRVYIIGFDSECKLWIQEGCGEGPIEGVSGPNDWEDWHHEPECTDWEWEPPVKRKVRVWFDRTLINDGHPSNMVASIDRPIAINGEIWEEV